MVDESPHKGWKLLESRPIVGGRGRLVCVANQKGGVAKTTTSVNLAAALALRGHRVLVVDVDPQANATTGLGIDHRGLENSTYELLMGEADLDAVVRPTAIEGLMCAPAAVDLAGAEIELVASLQRELKLAEALAAARSTYEVVFIDCPPSLGLLTVNALAAAEDLIVPVQCEYYALEGLGQMLETAERVRRVLNPELRVAGFLMTMYDARTKLSSQVADEVRAHFGDLVFGTVVPRSVRLSEAPSFGEPVVTLDPSSRGSISYRLLAAEFESRYGLDRATTEEPRDAEVQQAPPPPPPPPPTIRLEPEESAQPSSEEMAPQELARAAVPGPGGRGYGVVTARPDDLDSRYPVEQPWRGGS